MRALSKIRERIQRKGLRNTLRAAFKRFVFYHWELLWMERDLVSPVPPHRLKAYTPLRVERITVNNVQAFAKHFGDRVEVMRELAAEGHTGLMFLDDDNHTCAFIWGSSRHYHDRHFYGCWFPVQAGEFFEFGGELIRKYWGTRLSLDIQLEIWKAMAAQGCTKVVDVCESDNIPALKLHLRTGYKEQGRIMNVYCLFGRWKFFRETRYTESRLEPLRKPERETVSATAS
ncbi:MULTISPECIES: N-acetyltransferase [Pseudomonas]|jgi:RimJ/RimL family protein N-acetyltransferase|uniref:N-acetyltransferase n=1 Tax=Pseudomonas urmiensis TaxID=2745493 RepID=A0A923FY34_9PSED|nr:MULTISPECIES: N-acetyltransferase [Pseudomonas]MBV4536134.1 N-acetyltransferase [Pseudomonas urmiensis]